MTSDGETEGEEVSADRRVLNYAAPKPRGFFWGIIGRMVLSVLSPYLVIWGLLAFLVLVFNFLIHAWFLK